MDGTVAGAIGIAAGEDALDLRGAALEHGALGGDGDGGAVAADLGRVVDEVLGGVGVVALVEVVLDEDFGGEVGEDGELFVLGGEGLGGWWAAQGVVFAVVVAGVREHGGGEGGEQESREEHRAEHFGFFGFFVFDAVRWADRSRGRRLEATGKNRGGGCSTAL